ncbi:MAG: cytochrome c biogenesis protein CcsA [Pyrinomonadaceae bacterium]|nr:cytochrome c biogenesis protein CcsA [Pyrinomonadaceae bacterium]
MSQVIAANEIRGEINLESNFYTYLPAVLAIVGGFLMMFGRFQMGNSFISDSALMMIALACYLLAALFELTNLYAPSQMAQKIGMFGATLGVFFNLSSWLVRWVSAYELEIANLAASGNPIQPWFFRYIPFANLYDFSIAFAFGAGIGTLLIANRKEFRFITAFSLPLACLILTLARFIGAEIIDLPPVLDSYWRPIHVGVASLSYGITLVCFAIAVIYLLKDKVKVESMGIWASIFSIGVIATISKFSVLTEGVYRSGLFLPGSPKPMNAMFRLELPYVGIALAVSAVLSLATIVAFMMYLYQNKESGKKFGHIFLKLAVVAQIVAVGFWISGIKSTTNIEAKLTEQLATNSAPYIVVGKEIASRQQMTAEQISKISATQFEQAGKQFFQERKSEMFQSFGTNPVEFSGILSALAGLAFIILFSFRTENLREKLPSLEKLDGLMYKTASLAFAGLAMLLITGAIWANESWGRPWGFDSKETGALVAWLTYAAFLHTRISRGWSGRSSAYFAILGFFFVIFTYLGVSYLLPGLHSYA